MGLDPLVTAVTGPNAVNQAFRMNYMPPQSILVISDHGLKPESQYSMIACAWLEWVMLCEAEAGNPINIQYALNGGEHKVGPYTIDGFYDSPRFLKAHPDYRGKIAFEFYGVSKLKRQ